MNIIEIIDIFNNKKTIVEKDISDLEKFIYNYLSQSGQYSCFIIKTNQGNYLCYQLDKKFYTKLSNPETEIIISIYHPDVNYHKNNIRSYIKNNFDFITDYQIDNLFDKINLINKDTLLNEKIKSKFMTINPDIYVLYGGSGDLDDNNQEQNNNDVHEEPSWGFIFLSGFLSLLSMIPLIGIPFNIANTILSWFQKDYIGIALSIIGTIPFIGIFANSGKLGRLLFKILPKIYKAKKLSKKYTEKIKNASNKIIKKTNDLQNSIIEQTEQDKQIKKNIVIQGGYQYKNYTVFSCTSNTDSN